MKDFMEQQLRLVLWHSFILVLNGREEELKKICLSYFSAKYQWMRHEISGEQIFLEEDVKGDCLFLLITKFLI